MKKIVLFVTVMLGAFIMQAQHISGDASLLKIASKTKQIIQFHPHVLSAPISTRAVDDTIWTNDFSDSSKWKMYSGNGSEYSGHWVIQDIEDSDFGYGTGTIHSATWQNGYAAFDADKNGSEGMDTSDEYIEYTEKIDCSSLKNVIFVGQQHGRKWQTTHVYVEVSTDSINWKSFEINKSLPVKILADSLFAVNISFGAANKSVYLRLHYKGKWDYGWCFDDLAIIEGPKNDIAFEYYFPQFYSGNWYRLLPKHQSIPVTKWKSTVINNGYNTATGVELHVKVLDEHKNTAYSFSYDTLVINGSTDTMSFLETDTLNPENNAFYIDTTTTHQYTFKTYVSMDSTDQHPLNDTAKEFYLDVTDTVMARSIVNTSDFELSSYYYEGIASSFYLPNKGIINSVTFYLSNRTSATAKFTVEIMDQNFSTLIDKTLSVTSDMIGKWVTISLKDNDINYRITEKNKWYFVGIKREDDNSSYFGVGINDTYPYDGHPIGGYGYYLDSWYYINSVPTILLNIAKFDEATILKTHYITNDVVGCYGDSTGSTTVVITAGTSPFNYYWSTGDSVLNTNDTNCTLSNLVAGNYSVTITDNNGYRNVEWFTINQPETIHIYAVSNSTKCYGDSTGAISLSVTGGTGEYAYNWSTGDSLSLINNLPAGNYMVTVTDEESCMATQEITVLQPSRLVAMTEVLNNATSSDTCDGIATVLAAGGVGNYQYVWSDSNTQTTDTAYHLCPGVYTVTVSDSNECFVVVSATILSKDTTNDIALQNNELGNIALYPNPNDGSFTVIGKHIVAVDIYNANGQLIEQHRTAMVNRVFLKPKAKLTEGIYFVKIMTQNAIVVKKVMVK